MINQKTIFENINREIGKVISGKENVIKMIATAILAGGHVLLEDVPGVGKTTLALAFSKAFDLSYRRMQFTPDVLPSDVIGFSMYNKKTDEFQYMPGVAMCNILLADEINRTSPKTQAALLEVMEEKKVTVDGVTRMLPNPFFVIATQNPVGYVGTQKLPESQLDRFMIKLSMGYPEFEDEVNIYKGKSYDAIDKVERVLTGEEVSEYQKQVADVYVEESIYRYATGLVRNSRENDGVELGVSPRGGIALLSMSKATAFLEGRDYVVPEDILSNIEYVFGHRIVLNSKARAAGKTEKDIIDELIRGLDIPAGKSENGER